METCADCGMTAPCGTPECTFGCSRHRVSRQIFMTWFQEVFGLSSYLFSRIGEPYLDDLVLRNGRFDSWGLSLRHLVPLLIADARRNGANLDKLATGQVEGYIEMNQNFSSATMNAGSWWTEGADSRDKPGASPVRKVSPVSRVASLRATKAVRESPEFATEVPVASWKSPEKRSPSPVEMTYRQGPRQMSYNQFRLLHSGESGGFSYLRGPTVPLKEAPVFDDTTPAQFPSRPSAKAEESQVAGIWKTKPAERKPSDDGSVRTASIPARSTDEPVTKRGEPTPEEAEDAAMLSMADLYHGTCHRSALMIDRTDLRETIIAGADYEYDLFKKAMNGANGQSDKIAAMAALRALGDISTASAYPSMLLDKPPSQPAQSAPVFNDRPSSRFDAFVEFAGARPAENAPVFDEEVKGGARIREPQPVTYGDIALGARGAGQETEGPVANACVLYLCRQYAGLGPVHLKKLLNKYRKDKRGPVPVGFSTGSIMTFARESAEYLGKQYMSTESLCSWMLGCLNHYIAKGYKTEEYQKLVDDIMNNQTKHITNVKAIKF